MSALILTLPTPATPAADLKPIPAAWALDKKYQSKIHAGRKFRLWQQVTITRNGQEYDGVICGASYANAKNAESFFDVITPGLTIFNVAQSNIRAREGI